MCLHAQVYSDITGQTQIFILGAGTQRPILFKIPGTNSKKKTAGILILSHARTLLHLLVSFFLWLLLVWCYYLDIKDTNILNIYVFL